MIPEQAAAGELREQTRLAHLDYLKQHSAVMHLGGPFKNNDGGIIGTLFIVDLPDRAAAMRFTDEEPFHKAGVLESVLVRRWRQMQPEVALGANATSAREAALQFKQEGQ